MPEGHPTLTMAVDAGLFTVAKCGGVFMDQEKVRACSMHYPSNWFDRDQTTTTMNGMNLLTALQRLLLVLLLRLRECTQRRADATMK